MKSLFCGALALLTVVGTQAATVTNVVAADTTLHEGFPNNNLGAFSQLNAGRTGVNANNGRVRALLRFDLTGKIPAGATITAARLNFSITRVSPGSAGPMTFELHRLLKSWTEGDKTGSGAGAPATVGETTWTDISLTNVAWGVAGAAGPNDSISQASATVTAATTGNFTFASNAGLLADVRAWATNGGTNFGWVLKAGDETVANSARGISAKESPTPPTLEIDYTLPTATDIHIDSITRGVGGLTLNWTGGNPPYRVSAATNILGPWGFVTAASPNTNATLSIPTTNTFYRVAGDAL